MFEDFLQNCKTQRKIIQNAPIIIVSQNSYQHSDFLIVGWLINLLSQEKKVLFIAFRQNFSHYLSLSKKLGKSIEGYIKNKQLTYIQCFQSDFCTQLPLTESPPTTYVSPPNMIHKHYVSQLTNKNEYFQSQKTVIIDSVSYINDKVQVIFWIYQQALMNKSRIILGGCQDQSPINKIIQQQCECIIKLQKDIGGYGKISVINVNNNRSSANILWKVTNNRIQFRQQITI